MKPFEADYYDGKTSVRRRVSLLAGGARLKLIGADVSEIFDLRRVRRSLRIANTPRWLYLPGGGACVTQDNDAVDRLTRTRRYDRVLQTWESRPLLAAIAVGLVAVSTWLLIDHSRSAHRARLDRAHDRRCAHGPLQRVEGGRVPCHHVGAYPRARCR